jgi:hypothetical protein
LLAGEKGYEAISSEPQCKLRRSQPDSLRPPHLATKFGLRGLPLSAKPINHRCLEVVIIGLKSSVFFIEHLTRITTWVALEEEEFGKRPSLHQVTLTTIPITSTIIASSLFTASRTSCVYPAGVWLQYSGMCSPACNGFHRQNTAFLGLTRF